VEEGLNYPLDQTILFHPPPDTKIAVGFVFWSVFRMKASNPRWKEKLSGQMPEALAHEVDVFESELELRKQGKLDERLMAETRLRRGVYGQRYDNGQRHDGKKVQNFDYPSGGLTKGPHTKWDAPGMQRIKIPAGGLNAGQLETLAELAEEYARTCSFITSTLTTHPP
jgi:sulfite reductase (ferredoxin)